MKRIPLLLGFIFITLHCLTQTTDTKKVSDLILTANITLDNVNNLSGGIQQGSSLLALFDMSATYAAQQGFFKNTSFHLHLLKTAGKGASENFIGDVQMASNIEGRYALFVYELLVRQKIGHWMISAGMHDLNSEFMMSDYAGDFINSSFGIMPSVSLNVPVSIFPATTFGGLISYSQGNFDVLLGFYNLNYEFFEEETFHFDNHFYQRGFLGVAEMHYRWINNNKQVAEFRWGGYLKKCNEPNRENMPAECVNQLNYGFFFIGDFALMEFTSGSTLGAFVQAGLAPQSINWASQYIGGGISYRCIPQKYFPEQIGIAVGKVDLNEFQTDHFVNTNQSETVIEVTATVPLTERIKFQPDIQYILSPSGIYNNALVALFRLKFDLL